MSKHTPRSIALDLREMLRDDFDSDTKPRALSCAKSLDYSLRESGLSQLRMDDDDLAKSNTGRVVLFSVMDDVVLSKEQEILAREKYAEVDLLYMRSLLLSFANNVISHFEGNGALS